MGMLEQINEFVDTMLSVDGEFKGIQKDIAEKKDNISEIVNEFKNNEQKIIKGLKDEIIKSGHKGMEENFNVTSGAINDAVKKISEILQEAVKGMKFIKGFENQFTVFIFGKVKAGKSYIGNFVMGKPLIKNSIHSSYDKINDLKIYKYDEGEKCVRKNADEKVSENDAIDFLNKKDSAGDEFYVDMKEATNTIQGGTIGGLSWFDTPGVGSVTGSNEALAKEYVKNSDLVIYAVPSDAPGTREEFEIIKELHDRKKPMLLLITQSDTIDEDCDDEGNVYSILVPKSEEDRRTQEQYIKCTLKHLGLEEVLKYSEILSVSAKLATEALENRDEKAFEDSNMGKLLQRLIDITRNNAGEIKKGTPKKRMNELLECLEKNLENTKEGILRQYEAIAKSKKEFKDKKEYINHQIKKELLNKIDYILSSAKQKIEDNGGNMTISSEEISAEILGAMNTIVQKVCAETFYNISNKVPEIRIKLEGIGSLKMKQDTQEYIHTKRVEVLRDSRGVIEWIGQHVLGKIYTTSKLIEEKRTKTINIGINDGDIRAGIMRQLNLEFPSKVDECIKQVIEGYFNPVEKLKNMTIESITDAIDKLNKLKVEVEC